MGVRNIFNGEKSLGEGEGEGEGGGDLQVIPSHKMLPFSLSASHPFSLIHPFFTNHQPPKNRAASIRHSRNRLHF